MSLEYRANQHDLKQAFDALERAGASVEKSVPRLVSDVTTLAYREAQRIARDEGIKKTGLYQQSTRMRLEGSGVNTVGIVGNAARDPRTGFPYPVVIETGFKTSEWTITPTAKKCLHFISKTGEDVFVKRVVMKKSYFRFPDGRHVFKRALEHALKKINELVRDYLKRRAASGGTGGSRARDEKGRFI